ncbi:MAG: TRAP transporter large permease subunit, partial [Gimesia chilikensis]
MTTTLIMILVLIVLIALLAIRRPIYAALGVTSAFGILLLQGVDGLGAVPSVFFDRMSGFTLVAAPLFILMGERIFRSGMGSDIYTLASKWLS